MLINDDASNLNDSEDRDDDEMIHSDNSIAAKRKKQTDQPTDEGNNEDVSNGRQIHSQAIKKRKTDVC